MMNNKRIGGFFELEIDSGSSILHKKAYALNNGRSSFFVILQTLKPSLVYVPFYCCDSLLLPLKLLNISYEFYKIDIDLQPAHYPQLSKTELIVYINYFGLKKNTIQVLIDQYQKQLIVDNTQAFFEGDCGTWSFNSARKYFGVPDGSYLYTPYEIDLALEHNKRFRTDHLIQRLIGNQKEAYDRFQESEASQSCTPSYISVVGERLLSNISYNKVAETRRTNYRLYEAAFGKFNKLQLKLASEAVPFCYPFFLEKEISREALSEMNLFIPALWKDVSRRGHANFELEKEISSNLLALPLDQRLTEHDVEWVISTIKNNF